MAVSETALMAVFMETIAVSEAALMAVSASALMAVFMETEDSS